MSKSRPVFRLMLLCTAVAALIGCDAARPPDRPELSRESRLPFDSIAFDVLADDVDGNGLADLAFTSHNAGVTQVFYQRRPREFESGPQVDAVGFHPGDLMRLPGEDRRLYLMSAEGENALRVFEPAADGSLSLVSELGAPSPRVAAAFRWPDSGLGIALAPFGRNSVMLIRNFEPETAKRGLAYQLFLDSALCQVHQIVAADINGDGVDELIFPEPRTNRVYVVRAPKTDETPAIETLWNFDDVGWPRNITAADLDQDGDIDLLVPDEVASPPDGTAAINVLLNDGAGQFEYATIPFPKADSKRVKGVRSIAFGRDRDGTQYLLASSEQHLALMQIPAGWPGEPVESRLLPFTSHAAIRKMLLTDLDQDGWVDAVAGLSRRSGSGLILWGPLSETFDAYTAAEKTID